jgi:hypothetical protein
MFELIMRAAIGAIGIFLKKAEEQEAWKRAIEKRIRELNSSGSDSADVRSQWEKLQDDLKKLEQKNEKIN